MPCLLYTSSKEELNKLIEDESVHYVFQPIVDAHTGDIFAYEALMRPVSLHLTTPADVLRIEMCIRDSLGTLPLDEEAARLKMKYENKGNERI